MSHSPEPTTHFGYETVSIHEKTGRVGEVFQSVASQYDLMNDLMSFGIHRLWKRFTLGQANIRPGHHILDCAGGTGDMSLLFTKAAGSTGHVILSDINPAMLQIGADKLLDAGFFNQTSTLLANAESIPLPDESFDRICIAFGLRNVTHKEKALSEFKRCLQPGGKLLILEFSKPILPLLGQLYDRYSFSIIPKLGEWVCKDAASYQYLAESIRMHPDQNSLKNMMLEAGFDACTVYNLTGGIVALHVGYVY